MAQPTMSAKLMPAAAVATVGAAIAGGHYGLQIPVVLLTGCSVMVLLLVPLCTRAIHFLDSDEQLLVQYFMKAVVHNGPGLVFLNPAGFRSATARKAETLGAMDYVSVLDTTTGLVRIEHGPQLLFLGPYEKVPTNQRGQGISLNCEEYILVEDKVSGEKRIDRGPRVWFPSPNEKGTKSVGISLSKTEYVIVENRATGKLSIAKGPCVWFPSDPCESASQKQTAVALQRDEYLRLKDISSGVRWVQRGEGLVFLEPTWRIEGQGARETGIKKAWVLKANEYLRLVDASTGEITVHRGEKVIFPGDNQELLELKKAVEIDGEHAAVVRNHSTGQLRLVTERQLFVPGPNETIEEVRELITLAEHEAMIVKDKEGALQYYYGDEKKGSSDRPRHFFLPPGAEIVKVWWSRGPRRDRKDISFERFDCRPHFMKFEFNCRTSDNVELVLEGVIFWELIDLPLMWAQTGDTSGDMVYHLRSQFIRNVAHVTLKEFMEKLHDISKQVLEEDIEFYAKRGIKVYSLEVTRYQCVDRSTSEILEQIIQETTSRMNRLSQAESENEVSTYRMRGQLDQARQNADLQKIQHEQAIAEANVVGCAEANRIATFMKGLSEEVPGLEDRIKMWQVLRKTEALSVVSRGGANLYFTPNDVDLSIESRVGTNSGSSPTVQQL
eukprot:gnl/TRDRNA2_/TRDRNA2_48899_c0_seq1.p1 gnl/TRDRNA2_/TRDRNA2_48899_c0~~gnl/TRDRNA2_/TRDRNA2_48899_c0_seq1.p1  ORF type:complete len:668 (+),score=117.10 gnl/TRDRNA2_/TRDRNA2_48899_c0_seq1:43-2046(+)